MKTLAAILSMLAGAVLWLFWVQGQFGESLGSGRMMFLIAATATGALCGAVGGFVAAFLGKRGDG